MIADIGHPRVTTDRWRTSVLRIIIVASGILAAVIWLLTFANALEKQAWPALLLDVGSYLVLAVALRLSVRAPDLAATLLVGMFYVAGLSMLCFTSDTAVSHLGVVFLYMVPVVAWIFFGVGWACLGMALNVLPFAYVLGNPEAIPLFGIDTSLPQGHAYVHTLLFLLLNICIPFALFRVLKEINSTSAARDVAFDQLRRSHALYQDMFEHAGGPTLICDEDGSVLEFNQHARQLLDGLGKHHPMPSLRDLLSSSGGDDVLVVVQLARTIGTSMGEFCITRQDGEQRDVHVHLTKFSGGQNLLVTLRDTTCYLDAQREIARARERQYHIEQHDLLTNLPNRHRVQEAIEDALTSYSGLFDGNMVAVASIRLNNLRQVNEKFDVLTGDCLILEFAKVLRRAAGSRAMLGRFRGAVFSLVFTDAKNAEALSAAIESLCAALPRQIDAAGKSLSVGTSIGVAFARPGAATGDELICRSEHALEIARKSVGKSFMFFDEDVARESRRATEIEIALAGAIDRGELKVHYQPQVRNDGEIESFEALLRWHSPELGTIPPGEFIAIAENSTVIHGITDYVVDQVCRQLRQWVERFGRAWPVAINLSGKDFQREDISALIGMASQRYDIPQELIKIEITETSLAENGDLVAMHLDNLAKRGFSIGLDDFGTGYSSLAKLSEFPISTIKIDRGFVSGIGHHERREQIVRATLSLAQVLDCVSVAEGVETLEQLEFLARHGCELFQGYLFSQALSADEVTALLEMKAIRLPGAGALLSR